MEKLVVSQTLNPRKSELARPHDSTVGVGEGFYWFSTFFLLFIVMGVAKAFWDDRRWRGNAFRFQGKQKNHRKA